MTGSGTKASSFLLLLRGSHISLLSPSGLRPFPSPFTPRVEFKLCPGQASVLKPQPMHITDKGYIRESLAGGALF